MTPEQIQKMRNSRDNLTLGLVHAHQPEIGKIVGCGNLPDPMKIELTPLYNDAPKMLTALKKAELFISGFEDDWEQEGIPELLAEIRELITK